MVDDSDDDLDMTHPMEASMVDASELSVLSEMLDQTLDDFELAGTKTPSGNGLGHPNAERRWSGIQMSELGALDTPEPGGPGPVDMERTPTVSATDGTICPSPSHPLARVPAKYRAMADAMVRDAEEAISDDAAAGLGWKEFAKQSGITMWRRPTGNGGRGGTCYIRARTLIKAPAAAVFALFIDAARAKEIDPSFELAEVIESFDAHDHSCLRREAYSGFWPVSGRDFCVFRHLRCRDDGALLICAKSVASPACLPVGKYVRGEVVLSALVLQPQGNAVLVDYIAMTDLKGKIPGYIKDKVAQSQPMDLARLRKIAEAEHPQLLAQLDPAAIPTLLSSGPIFTIEATPAAAPEPVAELDVSRMGGSFTASNEGVFSGSVEPDDGAAETPVPPPTPRRTPAVATAARVRTPRHVKPPAGAENAGARPGRGIRLGDDVVPAGLPSSSSKLAEAPMVAGGSQLHARLLVFVWSLIVVVALYYVNFELLLLPAPEAYTHAATSTAVLVLGGSLFWFRPPT